MKKFLLTIFVVVGFSVATTAVAEDYVLREWLVGALSGPLGSVEIQLGTSSIEEGATTSFTAEVFDFRGAPLEGAVKEWTRSMGTMSIRENICFRVDFSGTVTPTEGLIGTITPGIRGVISSSFLGTQTGTITVWEGPLSLGSPNPKNFGSVTVYSNFAINVTERPVPRLASLVLSPGTETVVVVGQSRTFMVLGYDQWGEVYTSFIPIWDTTVGTVSQGSSSVSFTAGTKTAVGIVTAQVGSITTQGTITLISDLLSRAEISPPTTTLMVGEMFVFTVTGFDQYGNSVLGSWTWSSGSPTMGSWTRYTATAPEGTYTLTAESTGVFGTATIVVVTQKVLSSLIIIAPATMTVGGTATFVVVGYDQYGGTITPTGSITWTSSAGTIATSGFFEAPTSVGTVTITVSCGSITSTTYILINAGSFAFLTSPDFPDSFVWGEWYPGTVTLIAVDYYGNPTVFREDGGTCTVYLSAFSPNEVNPSPGNKEHFLGNVGQITLPSPIRLMGIGRQLVTAVVFTKEIS